MVSYNNCDYIRRLYEDFFIYEVERPNSQSKKKNDIYREYIMTNYDPRVFASQMTISWNFKLATLTHVIIAQNVFGFYLKQLVSN